MEFIVYVERGEKATMMEQNTKPWGCSAALGKDIAPITWECRQVWASYLAVQTE